MMAWHISNKMTRQTVLVRSRTINPHLLPTRTLNRQTLHSFLENYRTVYLKPVYGMQGRGIVRVKKDGRRYQLQYGKSVRIVKDKQRLLEAAKRISGNRPYMVQRGVSLLTINRRPVDFRILMFKPHNQWLCMGIIGKQAAASQIVTNFSAGGKAITLREALKRSKRLSDAQCKRMERKLIEIGFKTARAFSRRYGKVRKLGIDVAIDQQLRVWIIEPNTLPGTQLFKARPNYRMIKNYSEQIARKYYK